MRTVVLGEPPAVIEELLARRRALGLDGHDEVWEGDYHVAPHAHRDHGVVEKELVLALAPRVRAVGLLLTTAFNLGEEGNFRVPDLGVHVEGPGALFCSSALVVVEVLSPDDETYEKLPFYAARGVREVLVAHPQERWVHCYDLRDEAPREVPGSSVLDVLMTELQSEITWP